MKQVIVVDASLKLPKGKLAAQVAHASLSAFLEAGGFAQRSWLDEGMPKVVLKANGQDELASLHEAALTRDIPAALIADAGRTVIAEGTITCLGLGPADDAVLDALTGDLKLL